MYLINNDSTYLNLGLALNNPFAKYFYCKKLISENANENVATCLNIIRKTMLMSNIDLLELLEKMNFDNNKIYEEIVEIKQMYDEIFFDIYTDTDDDDDKDEDEENNENEKFSFLNKNHQDKIIAFCKKNLPFDKNMISEWNNIGFDIDANFNKRYKMNDDFINELHNIDNSYSEVILELWLDEDCCMLEAPCQKDNENPLMKYILFLRIQNEVELDYYDYHTLYLLDTRAFEIALELQDCYFRKAYDYCFNYILHRSWKDKGYYDKLFQKLFDKYCENVENGKEHFDNVYKKYYLNTDENESSIIKTIPIINIMKKV